MAPSGHVHESYERHSDRAVAQFDHRMAGNSAMYTRSRRYSLAIRTLPAPRIHGPSGHLKRPYGGPLDDLQMMTGERVVWFNLED